MGVGFTEHSVLYIDDEVSVLDNIVYQGEGVLEFTIPALSQECIIYVWKIQMARRLHSMVQLRQMGQQVQ